MSAALWPLASQGDPETVGVVVKLMERRDMMDAKSAAREELWTERSSGVWTDPEDER